MYILGNKTTTLPCLNLAHRCILQDKERPWKQVHWRTGIAFLHVLQAFPKGKTDAMNKKNTKGAFKEKHLPLSTACLLEQNGKWSKKKIQRCRDSSFAVVSSNIIFKKFMWVFICTEVKPCWVTTVVALLSGWDQKISVIL